MTRKGMSWLESLIVVMLLGVMMAAMSAVPGFAQSLPTVSGTAAEAPAPAGLKGYAGKLNLKDPVFDAIVIRELHDGMWLMGAQKEIWSLNRISDGVEVFHVAAFWASRPEGSDTAYGPSLGVNIGPALNAAVRHLDGLAELMDNSLPPFVGKLGDFASVDFYGGYRPIIGADDHHWIYGVGGKVTIPLDQLSAWIMKSKGGGL